MSANVPVLEVESSFVVEGIGGGAVVAIVGDDVDDMTFAVAAGWEEAEVEQIFELDADLRNRRHGR